uniref:Uncharacterized protein n=1 Tax=Pseudomonas phage vB_PaeM_HTN4 TaxID=3236645 RepID=A0AB39AHN5_9VIRU
MMHTLHRRSSTTVRRWAEIFSSRCFTSILTFGIISSLKRKTLQTKGSRK